MAEQQQQRSGPAAAAAELPALLQSAPRFVKVAATQMACSWDTEANVKKAEDLVRAAAADGANIILLQELFETPYFCQEQKQEYYRLAQPLEGNLLIQRFAKLAAELHVVLPISFFERAGNAYFNSLVVADADGSIVGHYRKSHIPDGPGYQEKCYFSPGDTGVKVFKTRYGDIGVLICWDQARQPLVWLVLHCWLPWFPEAARCAALLGAELPVVASNRIGTERFENSDITFYGGSFIAGPTGEIVVQAGSSGQQPNGGIDPEPAQQEGYVLAGFDLDECRMNRAGWGMFRDRRPDLYGAITTLDGSRNAR
ncbi:N-carbamoylputrescine amidase [Chlorella vulgaris]